jgi:hypothetical protein
VTEGQDIGFDFEEPTSQTKSPIGSEGLGISGTPQVPARPSRESTPEVPARPIRGSTPEVPARPSIPPRPAKKNQEESKSASSSPQDVVRPVPVVPQRPTAKDQSMPSVPPRPQRASSEDTSSEDTGSSASAVGRERISSPPVVPSRPMKRPTTSGSSNSESSTTASTPSIPPRPTRAVDSTGDQPPDPLGPLRGDPGAKEASSIGTGPAESAKAEVVSPTAEKEAPSTEIDFAESAQGEKAEIGGPAAEKEVSSAGIESSEGDQAPLRGDTNEKTEAVNPITEKQQKGGSLLSPDGQPLYPQESGGKDLDEKEAVSSIAEQEPSIAEEKGSGDACGNDGEPEPTPVVPPRPADNVAETPQSDYQEADKKMASRESKEGGTEVTPVVPAKHVEAEGNEGVSITTDEEHEVSTTKNTKNDPGVTPVVAPRPVSEEKESDIGSTEQSVDLDASTVASNAKDSAEENVKDPEPMLEETAAPIPCVDVQEDSEKTRIEPPQPSDALYKSTAVDVDSIPDHVPVGTVDRKASVMSETETKELLKTESEESISSEPISTQKKSPSAQEEEQSMSAGSKEKTTESNSIPAIPSRPSRPGDEQVAAETDAEAKSTPSVPSRPSKSREPSSTSAETDELSTKEKSGDEPASEANVIPSIPSRPSKSKGPNTDGQSSSAEPEDEQSPTESTSPITSNQSKSKDSVAKPESSAEQSPEDLGALSPESKPQSQVGPVVPPRPTSRGIGRAGSIESVGSDADGRQSVEPELVEQLPSKTVEKAVVDDDDDDIQEVKVVSKATPEVPARPTAKAAEGKPAPPPKPKKLPINSKVGALRASLFNDLNQVISAGGRRPPGGLAKDQGGAAAADPSSEAKTLDKKNEETTTEEEPKAQAPPTISSTRRRTKGPQRRLPTAAKSEWSTVINDVWSLYIPTSCETTGIATDAKEEPELLMHETDQEAEEASTQEKEAAQPDADSSSNYSSGNESTPQDPKNESDPILETATSHPDGHVPAAIADPKSGYANTTTMQETDPELPQIETVSQMEKQDNDDSNRVSDNTVL